RNEQLQNPCSATAWLRGLLVCNGLHRRTVSHVVAESRKRTALLPTILTNAYGYSTYACCTIGYALVNTIPAHCNPTPLCSTARKRWRTTKLNPFFRS